MNIRRDVFQALADPTRRVIVGLVALQSMTPGEIAEKFDSTRQTISKHIQILTECELLGQTQSGREIYYHLNLKKLKEVGDWLEPYRKMWEGRFDAIEDLLDEMQKKKTKRKK
ncbi:ArsR/SmtB family transcription factor [Chitinophaga sp. 22321]|uniref:Winged helix-turn-helix transcriptional regulator n=1 Tax=Chitinophaga hostae TaxID=2831022 RepID=A0ABS5J699_9BACT|nr:metalloregulator ArsR/SmtB family transcription factor [Chitinophaga hostae]MBS0030742.1 winged helix-turn-helix transcriptional regulator [Chitinophaga hostae]